MAAPSMNVIAERYTNRGVGSIFLYTHEAHPGEIYPHLTSIEQKYKHARDLRDKLDVKRPILLDSLDGACHRAYGSMPNMTWIFTRKCVPIYKSDWTDASSVENALTHFLAGIERRKSGERVVPFSVERLDFRTQDREAFYKGLEMNGPKAVEEFRAAFG
jgi:hypothetical protein